MSFISPKSIDPFAEFDNLDLFADCENPSVSGDPKEETKGDHFAQFDVFAVYHTLPESNKSGPASLSSLELEKIALEAMYLAVCHIMPNSTTGDGVKNSSVMESMLEREFTRAYTEASQSQDVINDIVKLLKSVLANPEKREEIARSGVQSLQNQFVEVIQQKYLEFDLLGEEAAKVLIKEKAKDFIGKVENLRSLYFQPMVNKAHQLMMESIP